MNYTEQTKRDSLENIASEKHSRFAFICAVTKCLGNLAIYKEGFALEYEIKQENFAIKFFEMLKEQFGAVVEMSYKTCESGTQKNCVLRIESSEANAMLKAMHLSHYDSGKFVWLSGEEFFCASNREYAQSYMQGVFLSTGSMYMPEGIEAAGGYQIEMIFAEETYAEGIAKLLESCGLTFVTSERGNSYVLYSKNGETIKDFLAFIKAMNSVMEISNIMVNRETNNHINRVANAYAYNSDKIVNSNAESIRAIEYIDSREVGLDYLGDKLKFIAQERLKDNQESMGQLAERLKMSKTTLSRNLAKIKEMAEVLKNGK